MDIGARIRAARKEKGLTQEELGVKLGVSGSMIAQYETSKRKPKYETVERIAVVLGVDDNWLRNGKTLEQRDQELKNEVDGKFDRIEKLSQIKQIYERLNIDGKLEVGELFINSIDSKHIDYVINHMKKLAAVPQYQIAPKR